MKTKKVDRLAIRTDEKAVDQTTKGVEYEAQALTDILAIWPGKLEKPKTVAELIDIKNDPELKYGDLPLPGTPLTRAKKKVKLLIAKANPKPGGLNLSPEKLADMIELDEEDQQFAKALSTSHRFVRGEYLEIVESKVQPVDGYKEKIREEYTTYVTDPSEIQDFKAIEQLKRLIKESKIQFTRKNMSYRAFDECIKMGTDNEGVLELEYHIPVFRMIFGRR